MRALFGALAALLAWPLLAAPPRAGGARMAVDAIPADRLSPVGRDFMARAKGVVCVSTEHVIACAATEAEASAAAAEAELARTWLLRLFPDPAPPAEPVLLMKVSDAELWRKLTLRHRLRDDGLALQLGRELYVKDDESQAKRPDRIFHEMVHIRLREVFGERLPLWAEEGLASHYGWIMAVEMLERQDVVLERVRPEAREEDLLSVADLLKVRDYPRDEQRARAFYRQSEALVATLVESLGRDGLRRLLAELALSDTSEQAMASFQRACGLVPGGEVAIIAGMRERFFATTR